MLDCGADPDTKTAIVHPEFPYASLLHVAVASGSLELVKSLISHDAIIDVRDANENTPLHYGASLGRLEICEFLVTRGCSFTIKNKKKMEPLHASILSDEIKIFEYFLKKLNPYQRPEFSREYFDKRVYRGLNCLMIAIENGSINIFHYLMNMGVRLNSQDEKGRTALHWAVDMKNPEMIDSILRQRPNQNVKDK